MNNKDLPFRVDITLTFLYTDLTNHKSMGFYITASHLEIFIVDAQKLLFGDNRAEYI